MPQFINSKETAVTEAIDGTLRTAGGGLARLDGFPHIKVVVRHDWDREGVALISGGGSGHEPSHAGFVGQGMLTAAVCGEVFAEPVGRCGAGGDPDGDRQGGLLADRQELHRRPAEFRPRGRARARLRGLKVAMVVVDDDVALPDLPQARGVAGTLFVHKIAGALADQGADLETVTNAAQRGDRRRGLDRDVARYLHPARLAQGKPDRAGQGRTGLGIHGEAGIEQVDFSTARAAMAMVLERLAPKTGPGPHVALLNNLGGATPLEMAVLAEELLQSRSVWTSAGWWGPRHDDLARHAGVFDFPVARIAGRRDGAGRTGGAPGLAGLRGGQ